MNKKSQLQSVWPKIYKHLKTPRPGVNLGNFPSKLPAMNKIIIDPTRLSDNPQAIGYVSTEDADNNGVLDTIHIASPRLEEAMSQAGLSIGDFSNLDQLSNEQLIRVLSPFVELLSHEMGHIADYKHNSENPFPGGESVADSAARSTINSISLATNNSIRIVKESGLMNKSFLKKLADFADKMDKRKYTDVADQLDLILSKLAQSASDVNYDDVFNKGTLGTEVEKGDFDFRRQLKDMRESGTEPLDYDFRSKLKDMREQTQQTYQPQQSKMQLGNVRPVGDPYTYNFNANTKTFTVASAPSGKEQVIGKVIEPGSGGYQTLLDVATQSGLVEKSVRPIQTSKVSANQSLLTQLGFEPGQSITPEMIDPFIVKYQNEFNLGMIAVADRISAAVADVNPAIKAGLESSLNYLKRSNLTGPQALNIYHKNIDHILIENVEPETASRLMEEFKSKYALWQNVEKLHELKASLGSQNMADDELSTDKTANDFSQVFWSKSAQPFGRSNSKFTRI
jgi:hypothetical protein